MPFPDRTDSLDVVKDYLVQTNRDIVRLTNERDEARRICYVPGLWRCAKCGIRRQYEPGWPSVRCEPCEAPMWMLSERELREEAQDSCDRLILKLYESETLMQQQAAWIEHLEGALRGRGDVALLPHNRETAHEGDRHDVQAQSG